MSATHPHPLLNRVIHYGALALMIVMLLAALLQFLLAFSGAPVGLFALTAIITLLLIPPVAMLTAVAPAVTVSDDGLTIIPVIWRTRVIPWNAISAMKDFPLLPPESAEITRRMFVGRKNYHPAEGKMLLIPGLPWQYRVAGFFAGEGLTPIIALTNRAHTDYDALIAQVARHLRAQSR